MVEINWFTESQMAEVLEAAQSNLKPIFIDFRSPGCPGAEKMDTETYDHDDVIRSLSERFICIKYNIEEPNTYLKTLTGHAPLLSTPAFVVLNYYLSELRRFVGFQPPKDLLAELRISEALIELLRKNPNRASKILETFVDQFPASALAPEALYWLSIASRSRHGRKSGDLISKCQALRPMHPNSSWWVRVNLFDVDSEKMTVRKKSA